jgi:hypothetical protein
MIIMQPALFGLLFGCGLLLLSGRWYFRLPKWKDV